MKRLDNWPTLLFKFNNVMTHTMKSISSSNDVTSNEVIKATLIHGNEGPSFNRHIAVLQRLFSCKGTVTTFINLQLAVITLHRLLNQVSSLNLIALPYLLKYNSRPK
jgi:hypothetical protein